jgi:hypothetical protein
VKLHTVAPDSQFVENLQSDTVLDTFYYTSFADTVYYSVSGKLYGLSSSEQEGLDIEYYVNGSVGYELLRTDVDGKYVLDSLSDSTSVTVIAPDVAGYKVYPPSYTDIKVGPSYYGANFVYVKIPDTIVQKTDTVYCIKGRVYGLPDNTGVTIYYRIMDSSNVAYTVTDVDSTYSICGLPYGCRVQVSAESREGFVVNEYYDNLHITDTLVGKDFNYDSIPVGFYTITGTVYVDNVATPGVAVYSSIGNALHSYITNSQGKYTIVVPENMSLSIYPSYMSGYNVDPSGGYSIVKISTNSTDNDFNYYPLSSSDTVSSLCGMLEGLPDSLRNRQTVTAIVQGVVYYTSTNVNGEYCFIDVPAHSIVVVLPPDVSGYDHTPDVRIVNMPAKDTTILPFVYSLFVKHTVSLCGIVSGLPDNSNVLVTYFVGNDIDTLLTDSTGSYCIEVLEGDYVRIVPSYQEGYRFLPDMYFFRADSDSSGLDIRYILIDSDGNGDSVNISGIVFRDGEAFSNALLHYTVTSGVNTVSGIAMTDIYGKYYINGLEKGSSIKVTPDYVKLYTVTPALQFVENLQADSVLDTFYYIYFADSVADTEFYSVDGTLYGLSASEKHGLNVEYYVDDANGYYLLFTDADGKYIIDSLRDGMSVMVIAPVVEGYTVRPSSYTKEVGPSYHGANFFYTKIVDIVPVDTARFESVVINGEEQPITDVIYYLLPCKDSVGYIDDYIDVVLMVSEYDTIYGDGSTDTTLRYIGEREYIYTVHIDRKAFYKVDTVIVTSTGMGYTAEQLKHTYIIIVEKRFEFYDIVV